MSGLHERLNAKLDELEALAKGAAPRPDKIPGMGQWFAEKDPRADSYSRVRDAIGAVVGIRMDHNDAALIAATASPDVVLRGLAEDRDILRRHAPDPEQDVAWADGDRYPVCAYEWADGDGWAIAWHCCPDVWSLASRHGVSIENPS